MKRRGGCAVLIGTLPLLTLAWLWIPSAPPLYDSLQGPAPPYRYLTPAAGLGPQHRNPRSGRTVEKLTNGRFTETLVRTTEQVSQALLELGDGAVRVPAGVASVTLSVRPVPLPSPIPSGDLDGNVYLFRATANKGQALALDPKVGGLLELRKTGKELTAQMETYTDGSWVSVPTLAFVNANYLATDAKSFGYYALVTPSHKSPFPGRYLPLLIAALVVLILVITAFVAIRLTRSRSSATA